MHNIFSSAATHSRGRMLRGSSSREPAKDTETTEGRAAPQTVRAHLGSPTLRRGGSEASLRDPQGSGAGTALPPSAPRPAVSRLRSDLRDGRWPSPAQILRGLLLGACAAVPYLASRLGAAALQGALSGQRGRAPSPEGPLWQTDLGLGFDPNDPEPEPLDAAYWAQSPAFVADAPLTSFADQPHRLALVVTNAARPQNVETIVARAATYATVEDILVIDQAPYHGQRFVYRHPKVHVVRAGEVQLFGNQSAWAPFHWGLLAQRENVLLQDDSTLLSEEAMADMLNRKRDDPDRLICFAGEEIHRPNPPIAPVFDLRRAKAGSYAALCDGRATLTDRGKLLEAVRLQGAVHRSLSGAPRFAATAVDIVHSLAVTNRTGKLHHILGIHPKKHTLLGSPAARPVAPGQRAWTTRAVAHLLGLRVRDLATQSVKSGMLIPRQQDPPVPQRPTPVREPTATLQRYPGKGHMCVLSLFAGGYGEFGEKIIANHRAYTARHEYPYWQYQGRISGDELRCTLDGNVSDHRGGAMHWQKLVALKNMMNQQASCDWVMWMDSDAFFTNFNRRLETIVAPFTAPDAPNAPAKAAIFSREEAGGTLINSGVFFVRNSVAGHRMVETLLGMYPDYRIPTPHRGLHDQDAIQDYVVQRMPETPKYHLKWDRMKKHVRPDLAVVRQRLFNSFDRNRRDPPEASWQPCDLVAHISNSAPERRIKRFYQLSHGAADCPAEG